MQKIITSLCFDTQAQEAVNFYVSIFKDAKILNTFYYSKEQLEVLSHLPESFRVGEEPKVCSIVFELFGQKYLAINGGPYFKFTQAFSFSVICKDQEEIDYYWDKLSADGGQIQQCGWLVDKFGISWQIKPELFIEMMHNPETQHKAMMAVFKMIKFDIEALKKACEA